MEKTVYQIFKTFFKIGTLLLGGGYVILPLLESEIVDKKEWVSNEDLCEYFALSQSIPGIIAANISIFVGYKLKGIKGALAAITGVVLPAFIAIVILARIVVEIVNLKFVQSLFWGVGIGVLMLIFLAVKEIWKKSVVDKLSCSIFVIIFILSACFKISPAILIIISLFFGLWLEFSKRIKRRVK